MAHRLDTTESGFTLIEMLVATAIFVIVVSALASAILYVTKLQRRTNALRIANDNVRYLTDFLSKEIRNGTPNFDGNAAVLSGCGTYPGTSGGYSQSWFQLQNVSGDQECFFLSSNTVWVTKEPAGTTVPLAPQPLNVGAAEVTALTFTITNQGSIQNGANADNQQPYVEIRGVVVSNRDPQNVITVPFETSVSLPIYGIPHS